MNLLVLVGLFSFSEPPMERTLTDADVQALATAFHQASVEHCRYRTSPDEHDPHHQFIQMMMEKERRRRERLQKIQDYVAGSLVLTFLLSLIAFLGASVISWLRQEIKKG